MTLWHFLPAAAVLLLALVIRSSVKKRRKAKEGDFSRKLETVLQPRETVKAVCPNRGGRWILTSKRVLLETKEGFTAIPFSAIRQVQGINKSGNRTTVPKNMTHLLIKGDAEYTLPNTSEAFEAFAAQLMLKTKKKPKKKASTAEKKA